jgi:hypothetical protein
VIAPTKAQQKLKGQSHDALEEREAYKAVPLFQGDVTTLPLLVRSLNPEEGLPLSKEPLFKEPF